MRVRNVTDQALMLFGPDGVWRVGPREEFWVPDGTMLPAQVAPVVQPKRSPRKEPDA